MKVFIDRFWQRQTQCSSLLLALVLTFSFTAQANLISVTSKGDSGGGTLRSAISTANGNGSGLDTISIDVSGDIILSSALPNITSSVTLIGGGANDIAIKANSSKNVATYNVLNIIGAGITVKLYDVSIMNGKTSNNGGGIRVLNAAALYLYRCNIEDNISTGNSGGGVDVGVGNFYAYQTSFINNSHNSNGGGLACHQGSNSTVEVENCTFSGNSGNANQSNHGGGAFHMYSFGGTHTIKFTNCTFSDNVLGGSQSNNGKSLFFAPFTGATYNLTVLNCILNDASTGNYYVYPGGGTLNLTRTYTLASDATMSAMGAGNSNSIANPLDSLGFYNGTTLVYGIDSASAAKDAGDTTNAPGVDQRGVPTSGSKDVGAFEYFEQACETPTFATTYSRNYASRLTTITNLQIDNQGTVATLSPGQIFTVTFNYSINQSGSFCPGCVTQIYWGVRGKFGRCIRSFGGYCNCSGTQSAIFRAPTAPGIYFFTTGGSLNFSCRASPQNYVSAGSGAAFGAIVVGSPVNGNSVTISGSNTYCPGSTTDSLTANTFAGFSCSGNSLTSFQWFKDSVLISGSNSEKILVEDYGLYYVRWYNGYSDEAFSDTFRVVNEINNLNDTNSNISLGNFTSTLTSYPSSVIIPVVNSQAGVTYNIVDSTTQTEQTTDIAGTGGTINLTFTPTPNETYFVSVEKGFCNGTLDSVIVYRLDTIAPYAGLGNKLYFDGSNDYVNIPHSANLSLNSFTIEAWFKTSQVAGAYKRILQKRMSTGRQNYSLAIHNGKPHVRFDSRGGKQAEGTVNVNDGKWHHIAGVHNTLTNELILYVDGFEAAKTNGVSNPSTGASPMTIGGKPGFSQYYEGDIDEIRVWNVAKTEQEIYNSYRVALEGNETGLVAYYTFNDSSGNVLTDYASGLDGTLTGFAGNTWGDAQDTIEWKVSESALIGDTAAFTMGWEKYNEDILRANPISGFGGEFKLIDTSGAIELMQPLDYETDSIKYLTYQVTDLSGNADTATLAVLVQNDTTETVFAGMGEGLKLNGSNQYITLPSGGFPTGNSARTLEAWVNAGNSAKGTSIVNWGSNLSTNNARFALFYDFDGTIRVVGQNNDRNGRTSIDDGKWHHVAATHNGSTMSLYIDGKIDTTHTVTYNTSNNVGYVGRRTWANDEHFGGSVDELKIWSVALDSADIADSYRRRVDTASAGLVAYYNFDNVNNELIEVTANQAHGTLVNIATPKVVDGKDSLFFQVSEDLKNGDTAAYATAWDVDGSEIKYQMISGNIDQTFAMDSLTGVLTINDEDEFNYYQDSTYFITYKVTEGGDNNEDTATIIVDLIYENGPPTISAIANDTICAGAVGDSLVFYVNDIDLDDTLRLTLSVISGDTNLIPNDSVKFYNNNLTYWDSARSMKIHLPLIDTNALVPLIVIVEDEGGLSDSAFMQVEINSVRIAFAADSVKPLCATDTISRLASVAELGTPGYSFIWNDPAATTDSVATGLLPGTYSVTVTDALGCQDSASASIVPWDTLTAVFDIATAFGNDTICNKDTSELLVGLPFNDGVFTGNGISSNIMNPQLLNTGEHVITYTRTVRSCMTDTRDTLWVNPNPLAAIGNLGAICDNTPIQTLNQGSPAGGYFFGTQILNDSTYQPSSFVTSDTIHYVFTNGFGCSDSVSKVIDVKAKPFVTASPLAAMCIDTAAFTLANGLPNSGGVGVYSDTINGSVVANRFIPAVAGRDTSYIQYKYTSSLTGCSDSVTFDIVVDTLPILSVISPSDICVNDTSISLTGTVLPVNGTYSGLGVNTTDSLSFDPAIAAVGIKTITYRYTDGNGCKADDQFAITVRPKPSIVFSPIADVCADADSFTLTVANPFGGIYSGPAIINDTTFVPSVGTPKAANSITYMVDNVYGCIDTASDNIYIDTIPVVSFTQPLGSICFNEEKTAINLGNPVVAHPSEVGIYSGTGILGDTLYTSISNTGLKYITYQFTDTNGCSASAIDSIQVDTVPFVSLASFNPVCEDILNDTLVGGFPAGGVYTSLTNGVVSNLGPHYILNTSNRGGAIDTIIYTFTDGNGCINSASQVFAIDSLPIVTVTLPIDTICHGPTSIPLTGGAPLGGFFAGNGVSNNNYTSYANSARLDGLSYTYTDANGCTNTAWDTMVVNPIPIITLSPSLPVFCEADPVVSLTVGSGTGNAWYSGQKGIYNDSLKFEPQVAKAGTHIVTYNLENNGCFNDTSFSIVVNPQPIVGLSPFNPICENLDTFFLIGGTPVGATGLYKGAGVTNGYFDPSIPGASTTAITYVFTSSFGCIDSATSNIEIKAAPQVTFNSFASNGYCEDVQSIAIQAPQVSATGGSVTTILKGKGIIGNTFNPTIAGSGAHQIWYVAADTNGCSDSASQFALVNPLPIVTLNAVPDICENGTSFTLTGGSFISFNGSAISNGEVYLVNDTAKTNNVFNPDSALAGSTYNVSYIFTDSAGCKDTANQTFDVLLAPVATLSAIPGFCKNEGPYQLVEGSPTTGGTGVYNGNGVFSGTFFPQFATPGIDTLTYTFTANNGCADTTEASFRVKAAPSILVNTALNYCEKVGIDTLDFANVTAGAGFGIYSGKGVSLDSIFTVDSAGVGAHSIQFAYYDTSFGYTCADSSSHILTVFGAPSLALQTAPDLCLNNVTNLNFGLPQGGQYYTDSLAANNLIRNNSYRATGGVGTQKIIYEYFDANGCWDTASTFLSVLPQPSVSLNIGDSIACISENLVPLSGGLPAGGNYLGKGIFQNQLYTQSAGAGNIKILYQYSDSNQCKNSDTADFLIAVDPVLNVSNDTIVCANTLVNLTASGAGAGALYTWSTGVQNPNISVNPTASSSYRVVGLDTNGCSDEQVIKIEVLPEIILTTSSQNASCGKSDGIANVAVQGGLPPFSYLWTSGGNTALVSGLKAGFYEVTATDANTCRNSASTVIKNTSGPTVIVNGITNSSCAGVADGAIALDIQGSVTKIQWSNGATTEDISGLAPGKYLLTVEDADSCVTTQEFEITAPDAMNIVSNVSEPNCGTSNGFVTLSVTGGVSPYRYDWSNSTSNDTLLTAGSGVYRVTVTDDNSCKDSLEVVVSDSGAPVISLIKVIQPDCGENNGEIHVDVNRDTLSQFRWSTGDSTYIMKGFAQGIYRATATDTSGCRGLTSINLNSITPFAKELCVATIDTATGLAQIVWGNTGAKEIEVFSRALGSKEYSLRGSYPINPNIYTDTLSDLIERSHNYTIKSTDSCGNKSELGRVHQTIYLTSQLDKENNVILRWTAYEGYAYSEYEIVRVENGVASEYGRAGIGTNELIISDEPFGATNIYYVIRVAAPQSCGPTDYYDYSWSNKSINYGSFNINIEYPGNLAMRKLYPNPNGGQFNLQLGFNAETEVSLHVTDMSGREIWNKELGQVFGIVTTPIDLLDNAAGVYQLRIEAGEEVFMVRIQVTK